MAVKPKNSSASKRVEARIIGFLDEFLGDPPTTATKAALFRNAIRPDVADIIDGVLSYRHVGYRDGFLIQAAFGLEDPSRAGQHTIRAPGARGVAGRIGDAFARRHIAAVRDAFQGIGKNTEVLARGNVPAFDAVLTWLDTATAEERETALSYSLAKVALTARNVLPCPDLKTATLTFYKVTMLLDALLQAPSGGAYQQYATAAFLHALIEEAGQGGPGGIRVETKRLNATDASSRVAGDIQILRGNRVEEAFEVTANDWRLKVRAAVDSLRSADLARVHILAAVEASFPANANELRDAGADITIIDVAAFLRTLAATMRKPARAAALTRLYELLDRYQPDIERVNAYVRMLEKHGLAD